MIAIVSLQCGGQLYAFLTLTWYGPYEARSYCSAKQTPLQPQAAVWSSNICQGTKKLVAVRRGRAALLHML